VDTSSSRSMVLASHKSEAGAAVRGD
jgi:hypothetical protein